MSARDALWEHVNDALDARRDPLDEPQVQRLLVDEPELLGGLVALRSGLRGIERSRRRRRVVRAAAALLVATLGLAGTWSVLRSARDARTATPSSQATAAMSSPLEPAAVTARALRPRPAPERSRILAFWAEVTVEGPGGLRATTFDGHSLSVTSASRTPDDTAPYRTPSFVAVASSVAMSR